MSDNRWPDPAHVQAYLALADEIPHRREGEDALFEHLPARPGRPGRVLDIGCGDGRLMTMVRAARPGTGGLALDFSPAMLAAAHERFDGEPDVEVVVHDLSSPLPDMGRFDAVVSSFAIHHVTDERKRALYAEVFDRLEPGGTFLNLEHVASPSVELYRQFLATMDIDPDDDDPSNLLAPVGVQLAWLREAGFDQVDCHWKWREMALLGGVKPGAGG